MTESNQWYSVFLWAYELVSVSIKLAASAQQLKVLINRTWASKLQSVECDEVVFKLNVQLCMQVPKVERWWDALGHINILNELVCTLAISCIYWCVCGGRWQNDRLREMICKWLQNKVATWRKIVSTRSYFDIASIKKCTSCLLYIHA